MVCIEFNADAGQLRVFDGKAQVFISQATDKRVTVKGGHELALNGAQTKTVGFNRDIKGDSLLAFNDQRSRTDYASVGNGFGSGYGAYGDGPGYGYGPYPYPLYAGFYGPYGYPFYGPAFYGGFGFGGFYGGGFRGGFRRLSGANNSRLTMPAHWRASSLQDPVAK